MYNRRAAVDGSSPGTTRYPRMAYFAMQYQVLFHDTMAYGTHHHTVNVKFQNIARETLLFWSNSNVEGAWVEQLRDIVMLTRESHSLNLEPVPLGGKVAILMTYEEATRSTVRLCFRVMDQSGRPVSCGYQVMVLVHKDTHELVTAPPLLTQYLDVSTEKNLVERLTGPSFAERVKAGGAEVKRIFPDEVRQIGVRIACADRHDAYPRLIDESLKEYLL
jgi:acyl-CoA thioesterase FadM